MLQPEALTVDTGSLNNTRTAHLTQSKPSELHSRPAMDGSNVRSMVGVRWPNTHAALVPSETATAFGMA